MELLFITLIGVGIGLAARYCIPQRHTHGVVLIPAVATAASALIWVGLTWAGLTWDGGWIWVITLAATALIAVVVAVAVGQARSRGDRRMLTRLSVGAARPDAA